MARQSFLCGLLLALLASTGCGNSSQLAAMHATPPATVGGPEVQSPQVALPAPSTLRMSSYTEASLRNDGAAFDQVILPHKNLAVSGTEGAFTPNWTPGTAAAAAGLAYGCYIFDASGYDRDFTIRFTWTTQQTATDFYVAVADFTQNKWVFYPGPATGILTLTQTQFNNSIETATGRMAVAVVLQGTQPWQLAEIRLGALMAPDVTGVSPLTGTEGTQVTFTATATGGPITSISWDFGGGATPDNSSALSPTVLLNTAASYNGSVTATNAAGQDTFNFVLLVNPAIVQAPQIVAAGPNSGVTGTNVLFSASNIGGPVTTWSWNFNGAGNVDDPSLATPTVKLGAVGQYTVTVDASNSGGSSPQFQFTLDVTSGNPPPDIQLVEFSSGGLTGTPGQNVTLQATIVGTPPLTYDWQFGAGATPSSSTMDLPPETVSNTPGTYPCTLMVTNADGSDTFPFDIIVNPAGGNPPVITDVQPQSGVHDTSVQFVATNTGGAVTTWQWNFFPGMGTVDDATLPSPTMMLGSPTPPVPCSVDATNSDGTSHFDFTFVITPF